MDDRLTRCTHRRRPTAERQAAYEASAHHFKILYRYRCDVGWGDGDLNVGTELSPLPDDEIAPILERIKLRIVADIQADGRRVDPQSILIEIDRIEPLD